MGASSTWSWMSSIWKVPPCGWRRISAATAASVSPATSSRIRADAAPCAPFTARNALVMATLILAGSKPTTAPFLRITLYSEYGLRAVLPASGRATVRPWLVDALSWATCMFTLPALCLLVRSFRRYSGLFHDPPSSTTRYSRIWLIHHYILLYALFHN